MVAQHHASHVVASSEQHTTTRNRDEIVLVVTEPPVEGIRIRQVCSDEGVVLVGHRRTLLGVQSAIARRPPDATSSRRTQCFALFPAD